jgi:GAF domain-containing protein
MTALEREPDRDALSEGAAAARDCIERSLRAARELLGMDIAWIAEFRHGQKIFRIVDGDGDSFGFYEGDAIALDRSYCQRVVLGTTPNVIRNTALEPGVRDLEVTATARIGCYVGVPIELVDGTVYGALCVASHGPSDDLADSDANFLRRVARQVAADLEEIGMDAVGD